MELDPNNLITLCEPDGLAAKPGHNNCHFHIGHLGNWFNYNRNVDKAAYDNLIGLYPKPGHMAQPVPAFKPVEITGANPAQAATAQTTEVIPTSYRSRRARK
jgi:hypothetical protein